MVQKKVVKFYFILVFAQSTLTPRFLLWKKLKYLLASGEEIVQMCRVDHNNDHNNIRPLSINYTWKCVIITSRDTTVAFSANERCWRLII